MVYECLNGFFWAIFFSYLNWCLQLIFYLLFDKLFVKEQAALIDIFLSNRSQNLLLKCYSELDFLVLFEI